jgi:hypothetical protein
MSILLIILLCTTSILYSADKPEKKIVKLSYLTRNPDSFPFGADDPYFYDDIGYSIVSLPREIADDAWGFSKKYSVAQYRHDIKLIELSEKEVMNPFWLQMKNESQEKKVTTLITIFKALRGDPFYLARRYNMAAAIYAGIDVPALQSKRTSLLRKIVQKQDYHLTKLLLTHGADANKMGEAKNPVIYYAETVLLAQLLIDSGVNIKETPKTKRYAETLLHEAIEPDHESALITLYRGYGIDPIEYDWFKKTPLMRLVDYAFRYKDQEIITRASFLLQDLPKEEAIALINATDHKGQNVFDQIKEHQSGGESDRNNCNALRNYLLNVLASLQDGEEEE